MTMRLHGLKEDPDPLPRPAPVGPGSAYAPVSAAVAASPVAFDVIAPPDVPARRTRALRSWRFAPTEQRPDPGSDDWRLVAVPHVWSRSEPDLADHKGPCWYAREVELDPAHRHQLRFEALDYVAVVEVDGTVVAGHEGGFTPVAVDLPHGAGSAAVAVRLDDQPEPGLVGDKPLVAAKRKVKGVQEFHDSRPGGFSASLWYQPTAGTRWGSGGVADDVTLVTTGDVRLEATFATAAGDALAVNWVLSNLTDAEIDVELRAAIRGPEASQAGIGVRARLSPGANRIAVRADVDGLRPWSVESRPLYDIETEVLVAGTVSDTGRTRFGSRRVDMQVEGTGRYQLHLDGRRMYVRAANYIPGVWWPELTSDIFRRDLELARAANVNSLGPHALALPERFYDAADEAGCLVYQDMPLNLGHDTDGGPLFPGGPTMPEASLLLAAELTYRLFNHPSVVYWCGHNEPAYQLAEAFGPATHPDVVRIREELEALPNEEDLDTARQHQWEEMDPTRPAWKASGLGRLRDQGDVHTYTGSLSTDPATGITAVSVPFLSEFGAWTVNFSAAEAPGAAGDWPPPEEAVPSWERRAHIWWSSALHAGRPERYPDFPTATFGAQLFGGMYAKLAIESLRRRKWEPVGAHRYHFYVDHWGDAGAGVLDRHRVPQLNYWAMAAANRPLLPIVEIPPSMRVEPGSDVTLRTWVVNDHHDVSGTHRLRWRLARLSGDECHVIGVDDPNVPNAFGTTAPPTGDLVVLPRRTGEVVTTGEVEVEVTADGSVEGPNIDVRLDDAHPTAYAVWLTLDGPTGTFENWGAFVVAPAAWEAAPGLSPIPRFPLRVESSAPYRIVRRWKPETVAEGAAGGGSHTLPPDQYVVSSSDGEVGVSLFEAVAVDLDAGRARTDATLPWPFDPALPT